MDKTMITAPSAPPAGPYSPGLAVGEWVFLAGQTGAGDTIEEQTEQALDKVVALLEQAGCTVADVVSCLVHLADLSTFQRYNVVYERYSPSRGRSGRPWAPPCWAGRWSRSRWSRGARCDPLASAEAQVRLLLIAVTAVLIVVGSGGLERGLAPFIRAAEPVLGNEEPPKAPSDVTQPP